MKFHKLIFQNQLNQLEIHDLHLQHLPHQIKLTNQEVATVVVTSQRSSKFQHEK